MNTSSYVSLILIAGGVLLGVGIILIAMANLIRYSILKSMREEILDYLSGEFLYRIRETVFNSVDSCLDIIPLKLKKVKAEIDRGEE